MKKIEEFQGVRDRLWEKLYEKKTSLEDRIAEEEHFENAFVSEQTAGISWFTKKIAIKPVEAKTMEMIKKDMYKKLYTEILIPEVKKITGKDLNIKLHTDREINVFIPEPGKMIELDGENPSPDCTMVGTILSSVPRTNRQDSNEPLLESFVRLQKLHANAIADRLQSRKEKPETYKEFNKRDFGIEWGTEGVGPHIFWSGHGADGFRYQPKLVIAPTREKGEYRKTPEMIHYLKTPTRHDASKLITLMQKGNKGTWHSKRVAKGGVTTGNSIFIEHPDRSVETIFLDDKFYKNIAEKFKPKISKVEEKINTLEGKIKNRKNKIKIMSDIKKAKEELDGIYAEAKSELSYIFLANDLHLGSESWPGRPNNLDGIRASQIAALQSLGTDKIKYSIITEALHGSQAWRAHDSRIIGWPVNPATFEKNANYLTRELRKNNVSEEEISKNIKSITKENNSAIAIPRVDQQLEMFEEVAQPVFEELMDNGAQLFVGAGNHFQSGTRGKIDEGKLIANLFDKKYKDRGLLYRAESTGHSSPIEYVRLPSNPNADIHALVSHQMRYGATEISAMMNQATGTREDALFVLTADRHHPGLVAERCRFGALDVGKQVVTMYVPHIGKTSSPRGTMAVGYNLDRDLLYSGRLWLDNVVDKVIGWENQMSVLENAYGIIKKATKEDSLIQEAKYYENKVLPKL